MNGSDLQVGQTVLTSSVFACAKVVGLLDAVGDPLKQLAFAVVVALLSGFFYQVGRVLFLKVQGVDKKED